MTKFLIIGDLHLSNTNSLQTDILHREIIKIIYERRPEFIVLLGDFLSTHEKLHMLPFNRAINLLNDIHETGIETFLLIGNHDMISGREYLTTTHAFNSLKKWSRMNVIDKCVLFEREVNGEIIKFITIPYLPNNMFMKGLKDCNLTDEIVKTANLVFCHQEFDGCEINKLSKSKCDKYPLDFPLCIAGHIHDYEKVQSNLIYFGTPYQNSFSEKPNKGINIITIKDGKIDIEKIKLSIPQKIQITINYKDLYSFVIPDGEVKIKIVGPILQVKELLKTRELATKFSNVKIVYSDTTEIKEIPENKDTLSFSEKIKKEFENDRELSELFQSVFYK